MSRKKQPEILRVRPADENHQVVTVAGDGSRRHRKKPCAQCPWRKDATGVFPAEAFRHSAETAYDMSSHVFSCHDSGTKRPAACAGFLLRGADHNLSVRLARMQGQMLDVEEGGHELHENYRAMAIANGVDPDDPVLAPCRD